MSKSKLEDYLEIVAGAYLIGAAFGGKKFSKVDLERVKAKRVKATEIYWQAGKKWAVYYDKECNVSWREEIKHDPFNLYGGGTDD